MMKINKFRWSIGGILMILGFVSPDSENLLISFGLVAFGFLLISDWYISQLNDETESEDCVVNYHTNDYDPW